MRWRLPFVYAPPRLQSSEFDWPLAGCVVVTDESAKWETKMTELRVDHESRLAELKTPVDTGSNESNAGAFDSRMADLRNAVDTTCKTSVVTDESAKCETKMTELRVDHESRLPELKTPVDTGSKESNAGALDSRMADPKNAVDTACKTSLSTLGAKLGDYMKLTSSSSPKKLLPSSFEACHLLYTMMCFAFVLVPRVRGQMVECDAYDPVANLAESTIVGQDWHTDWVTARQSAVNSATASATAQGLESQSARLVVPSLDTNNA